MYVYLFVLKFLIIVYFHEVLSFFFFYLYEGVYFLYIEGPFYQNCKVINMR